MKSKRYAKSSASRRIKSRRYKEGSRFQAMVMWETPREDSGEVYYNSDHYGDLIDSLLVIFKDEYPRISLSKNPVIKMATDNGQDILWKVTDNIKRMTQ